MVYDCARHICHSEGNMSEAYCFLDKMAHIPDLHPRRQFRHGLYMSLWHSIRRYPRIIRGNVLPFSCGRLASNMLWV